MIQETRSNKLLPAATVEKLLLNDTPSLPSGVKGIVMFYGLPSAATVLKLLYGSTTPAILSYTDAESWEDIESWNA